MNVSELVVLEGLSLGKTLTQIAAELSVGESAVSRSLSHMERMLGLQIVDRKRHRLRLTPTGRDLAMAATRATQRLRDFDDLVDRYRRGEAGCVRVLSSNTPANYVLPGIIDEFLEHFPNAEVQLHAESGHTLWPLFSQGQHDVGIGPAARAAHADGGILLDSAWSTQPLYEDAIVLFVSSSNPLGRRQGVALESLGEYTFTGMFGEPFWTRLLEHLSDKGLHVRRRIELKGMEGVKRLVESGQSVGVHIRSAVAREIAEGRLVALDIPDLAPPYRYLLAHRTGEGQLSLVHAFCTLVRQRLSQGAPAL